MCENMRKIIRHDACWTHWKPLEVRPNPDRRTESDHSGVLEVPSITEECVWCLDLSTLWLWAPRPKKRQVSTYMGSAGIFPGPHSSPPSLPGTGLGLDGENPPAGGSDLSALVGITMI